MIYCFANTPFSHTYNVSLDNTQTWSAQSVIVTLDYKTVYDVDNTNISIVNSVITDTNPNLPNPNNYSLTVSANSYQTQQFMKDSTSEYSRTMRLQTIFVSNTGAQQHANDLYITVKNSAI